MKLKYSLLAAVAACAMTGIANATPTVTYQLVKDDNGTGTKTLGDFAIYATDSMGDNGGLLSYSLSLTAGSFLSINNLGPETTYFNAGATLNSGGGFSFSTFRSGTNVNPITGSQDNISGNATLIYGFGQSAGNFAAHQPYVGGTMSGTVPASGTWNATLLLATGTYTVGTQSPSLVSGANTDAVDFNTNSGTAPAPITNTNIAPTTDLAPEPSTLGLLGCLAGGILYRRPRRKAVAAI